MIKFILPFLFCAFNVQAQIISVDVGHYLKSPGTVSAYGDHEFTYNQQMAKVLVAQLEKDNFATNLIGYNGDMSDLQQRARLADKSTLFVSIHHDALQAQDLLNWTYQGERYPFNDEVRGFGIFVSAKNPQFQQSYRCAQSVARKLMQTGFIPNYYHNKDIKGERKVLLNPSIPVYQYDNLIVLKSASIPAILIEVGVLTNRQEAQWISQDNVRLAFAQSVSSGIRDCLK